jgi:hypothetical protein
MSGRQAPCSFGLISRISSHPAVFFSHNEPANSAFSTINQRNEQAEGLLSPEVSGFGFVHGPWPSSIDDGRLGVKVQGRASCGLAAICLAGAVALCGCARVQYSIQQSSLQLLYYCNDRSESISFSCPRNPIWAAIAAVLVWFPLLGSGHRVCSPRKKYVKSYCNIFRCYLTKFVQS